MVIFSIPGLGHLLMSQGKGTLDQHTPHLFQGCQSDWAVESVEAGSQKEDSETAPEQPVPAGSEKAETEAGSKH